LSVINHSCPYSTLSLTASSKRFHNIKRDLQVKLASLSFITLIGALYFIIAY